MSAAKHTPGPWTMQTVRTSCGVCFKVGPFPYKRDQLIHACIYADYPSPVSVEYQTQVANATLIAAAPELLEALQDIYRELHWDALPPMKVSLRDNARAAIAKATGSAS